MSENRIPTNTYASPSALGVKPDVRLQAAFLTHAFVWMFVGLLVSAAVEYVVSGNAALKAFAADNIFILFIAQLALVFVISGAINRLSATIALLLFFVYAASLGLVIGLIVSSYSTTAVATAFLSSSAPYTVRSRSAHWPPWAGSCSWV